MIITFDFSKITSRITQTIFSLRSKFGAKNISIALLVLTLLVSGLAYRYHQQVIALQKTPQQVEQEELNKTLAEISRYIVLPDETPQMATVFDPELLKGQPFFTKAQKGDKVLIYSKAGKAILYNPSSHKIIDFAALSIGGQ